MMSASTIVVGILGAGLIIAWACMDYGGEQIIASFGRTLVRLVTFGRVRLPESDDSTAMGVGAVAIITFFLGLLLTFAIVR